jgi:S-adenosylmethionine hydrolase
MSRAIITLTTDFGLTDMYVGTMKGVILGIAPDVQIVDLTHGIAPQNLIEATVKLAAATAYFPKGTIHVGVVDPGVGSTRSALIVETVSGFFVAPDNGLLTLPLRKQSPVRAIRLTEKALPFCLPEQSSTFHGRDVFAPIAAYLAQGRAVEEFGEWCALDSLSECAIPSVEQVVGDLNTETLRVPILYQDHFGNLITALTRDLWIGWVARFGLSSEEAIQRLTIQAGALRWQGLARTYSDVPMGYPLAYWGSAQTLEIGIREGDAASSCALKPDESIFLTLRPPTSRSGS